MPEKSKQKDQEQICHFFLNLYRIQLGVANPDESLAKSKPLQSYDNGMDNTYELSVRQGGDWKSRRITIGPLGVGVQSKSRCYKVVYDDILVVKIPAKPINQFNGYLSRIYAERCIAKKLAPDITCVTPGISSILKKIPRFRDRKGLSPENLEQQYINELRNHPEAQLYLKIGPTFVYFMNLSEYPFLSDLIKPLHVIVDKIEKQITDNPRALLDIDVFTAIYGKSTENLFFNINDIYSEYMAGCDQLQKKYNQQLGSITHKMETGFIRHLAGKCALTDNGGMTDDLVNAWNMHLETTFQDQKVDINNFKKIATDYIRQQNFNANRPRFVGIISSILDLLYHLKIKNIAIRDLKPDNMLLISKQKNDAHLLSRPSEYSLGLIDIETAFDLSDRKDGFKHPMLAGTACYATPSHVFEKSVLKKFFNDVSSILTIQDWYAALGTIFNTVTGDILFKKTGRLLPEIIRARHRAGEQVQNLADAFKSSSWVFWRGAVDEFYENIRGKEPELKQISLKVPTGIAGMFCHEINRAKVETREMILKLITSQAFFKSQKNRQQLAKSSIDALTRYRDNWEKNINIPQTTPEKKDRILMFLQNLIWLKQRLKQETQTVSMLAHDPLQITSDTLLKIIFIIVFHAMYCPAWLNREPPRIEIGM
jgi:serine/threonine protein kinase